MRPSPQKLCGRSAFPPSHDPYYVVLFFTPLWAFLSQESEPKAPPPHLFTDPLGKEKVGVYLPLRSFEAPAYSMEGLICPPSRSS